MMEAQAKTETPAIFAAMTAVQAALTRVGVGKDGVNQQQNFKYRAWDAVQQALAPILADNKMLIIPRVEQREENTSQTKNGSVMYRVVLSGAIQFVSGVDGSTFEYPAKGEAMDSGDKATSKAITMMVKYAVLHGLCIPLEGVADGDAESAPETVPPRVTDSQAADLEALIDEVGADKQGFLEWLKTDSIENIPAKDFSRAVKALERKRAKVAA